MTRDKAEHPRNAVKAQMFVASTAPLKWVKTSVPSYLWSPARLRSSWWSKLNRDLGCCRMSKNLSDCMRMQTVEWEKIYICSWTELHEVIIVVEHLIVSKLGSNYYVKWLWSVCLFIWVTYKPRCWLRALYAHITIIKLIILIVIII